jgi:hypothetical protein
MSAACAVKAAGKLRHVRLPDAVFEFRCPPLLQIEIQSPFPQAPSGCPSPSYRAGWSPRVRNPQAFSAQLLRTLPILIASGPKAPEPRGIRKR